jgi:putative pyruvate formate lyase activating enzyme
MTKGNGVPKLSSSTITVSIMSQYFPAHCAREFPILSRTITYQEYTDVAKLVDKLGLQNGWLQEMDAPQNYLPDFSRKGHLSMAYDEK